MGRNQSINPKTDDKTSLKARIDQAESQFSQASKRQSSRAEMPAGAPIDAMALIGRIATELVAGAVVGGGFGWALDQWLGTLPLFLLLLFFLGTLAGTLNIWRMATGRGLKIGYKDEQDND